MRTLNSIIGVFLLLAATLISFMCEPSMAALGSPWGNINDRVGLAANGLEVGHSARPQSSVPSLQLAQAQKFKYEVPKATRSTPPPTTNVAPGTGSSRSTTRKSVPSKRSAPSFQGAPSTGGGGGGLSVQVGPFGFSVGGGGGNSCDSCRDSCYQRLHGTKKFSPCMKNCWNRYCRRR